MKSTHISIGKVQQVLNHQPVESLRLHTGSLLRRAAVLMPLVQVQNEWHMLYTRRTQTVQDHKGQVSFPGGAADPQDKSCENTALREAYEEIGLPSEQVQILGRMSQMRTITEFLITPVVGIAPWPFDVCLSVNEVDRVFTIPIDWLADERNYEEKWMILRNARQERVVIFQPYDGETLWGITARITLNFLRLIGMIE